MCNFYLASFSYGHCYFYVHSTKELIERRLIQNFNIPAGATPRVFELLKIGNLLIFGMLVSGIFKQLGRQLMYGQLLCPQYILGLVLHIHIMSNTYNPTQLYSAIQSYKQRYRTINSNTGL